MISRILVVAAMGASAAAAPCDPIEEAAYKLTLTGDIKGWRTKLDESCHKGEATGCYHVAIAADHDDRGHAGPQFAKAFPMLEQSCKDGCAHACADLGFSLFMGYGHAVDGERAHELLNKACRDGSGEGCALLSTLESDKAKIYLLRDRACTLGDVTGCGMLANYFEANDDKVHADEARARACKLGFKAVCK